MKRTALGFATLAWAAVLALGTTPARASGVHVDLYFGQPFVPAPYVVLPPRVVYHPTVVYHRWHPWHPHRHYYGHPHGHDYYYWGNAPRFRHGHPGYRRRW